MASSTYDIILTRYWQDIEKLLTKIDKDWQKLTKIKKAQSGEIDNCGDVVKDDGIDNNEEFHTSDRRGEIDNCGDVVKDDGDDSV